MSPIEPGTPAPEFQLIDETGERFTQDDLRGQTTIPLYEMWILKQPLMAGKQTAEE